MSKVKNITCSCCGKNKSSASYYQSHSVLHKHLKKLPVCKNCIGDIYDEYKEKYKDDKLIIYNLCRLLDYSYTDFTLESAIAHSESKKWKLYQSYITQLNSIGRKYGRGCTFDDSDSLEDVVCLSESAKEREIELDIISEKDITPEIEIFWGFGFDKKDYVFLELELSNWKQTHKCDNQAELTLLKEICIKVLSIRRRREMNKDTSRELKELQELMKTASVDPAKANAINDGRAAERFGVWIADIEEKKPAEWWEEQEKYVDMDNFKTYIKDFIVRPIKNFWTGAKDFIIGKEDFSFKD